MSGYARADAVTLGAGPLRAVAQAALAAAGVALVATAAVQAWQVIARYVLDSPAAWTEPVAVLLLKMALLLAAAVAVRCETHFRFALAADALGSGARAALAAFARLATAGIGVAFAVSGARLTLATWSMKTAGAPLSQGLNYLPFVVGGILFVAFALERLSGGGASVEPD